MIEGSDNYPDTGGQLHGKCISISRNPYGWRINVGRAPRFERSRVPQSPRLSFSALCGWVLARDPAHTARDPGPREGLKPGHSGLRRPRRARWRARSAHGPCGASLVDLRPLSIYNITMERFHGRGRPYERYIVGQHDYQEAQSPAR